MPHQPSLSIVIPLAPGERDAPGLLLQLRDLPEPAQIVLVHASPPDLPAPTGWPDHLGLLQITAQQGRARQLNAGAARAGGTWLWFLHADSRLCPGCLEGLRAFLARGEPALGWFRLAFRHDGPRLARLNAAGANWRARWLGIPFGDQGFVIRRSDLMTLGGFDEGVAYGEDHLFVWAARAAGIAPHRIEGTIATSARKYARLGWARTTWLHWRLTAAQAWSGWRRTRRS